ncbi:MAG: 50S ribosomal protein L1 [Planctomycetes bacterium]|nr:50S ribosomal protein L1 [Planctomycetota bacterium]
MKRRSKRYRALVEQAKKAGVDLSAPQPIAGAVSWVKKLAKLKFTESVDLAVHLNLDTKKADQQFRGNFALPHGTGRTVRVLAFVDDGDKIQAALAAGAVKAGGEALVDEVANGFMDFDVAISTPKMMRFVGKLGKVLGPRGLMPSPKSGTVADDIASAVKEFKGGKIEYRSDAAGNVQISVGKTDFDEVKLAENISTFLQHVAEHRPSSVKGEFIKNITVSSTMGPGFQVQFAVKEA